MNFFNLKDTMRLLNVNPVPAPQVAAGSAGPDLTSEAQCSPESLIDLCTKLVYLH